MREAILNQNTEQERMNRIKKMCYFLRSLQKKKPYATNRLYRKQTRSWKIKERISTNIKNKIKIKYTSLESFQAETIWIFHPLAFAITYMAGACHSYLCRLVFFFWFKNNNNNHYILAGNFNGLLTQRCMYMCFQIVKVITSHRSTCLDQIPIASPSCPLSAELVHDICMYVC